MSGEQFVNFEIIDNKRLARHPANDLHGAIDRPRDPSDLDSFFHRRSLRHFEMISKRWAEKDQQRLLPAACQQTKREKRDDDYLRPVRPEQAAGGGGID